MHRHAGARAAAAIALVLATGCAMRVTGVVRDASTGSPIEGAVLSANDGRNRLGTTGPSGRYAVKTDWKPSTLVVCASGYVTTTVAVPDSERFPVVHIDLERAFAVADNRQVTTCHPIAQRLAEDRAWMRARQPSADGFTSGERSPTTKTGARDDASSGRP